MVGMKWLLDTRTAKRGQCFIGSPLERLIQRTYWCCYWNFSFILRKCCGHETRNVAELAGCIKVPLDRVSGLTSPPVPLLYHCQKHK